MEEINITYNLQPSVQAFLGTSLYIQYKYVGVCNKCGGNRSELGYTGNICPYCEV